MLLILILMVFAFVCFVIAAVLSRASLWNLLVAAGLALWVLASILTSHPL